MKMGRRQVIGIVLLIVCGFLSYRLFRFSRFGNKVYRKKDMDLFFDENLTILAELGEVFIPRTDTPGAKDCDVHIIMRDLIERCISPSEQYTFINGIEGLKRHTLRKRRKSFLACTYDERVASIMEYSETMLDKGSFLFKVRRKLFGDTFIDLTRRLIVWGYCTSFNGVTKGMRYEFVPQHYQGCIPLEAHQKCWATK